MLLFYFKLQHQRETSSTSAHILLKNVTLTQLKTSLLSEDTHTAECVDRKKYFLTNQIYIALHYIPTVFTSLHISHNSREV